ncbi:MAG: hypothetical protein PF542_01855 [Nanoarchaeota archaeon]|jgi:hypothetical protein|nr:hypothetical protein [Nanoarchaeota archaeon]
MVDKKKNNNYLWIGVSIVAIVVLAIVLISNSNNNPQNEIICNSPYIKVGIECCLDQNSNSICDRDEEVEKVIENKEDKNEEILKNNSVEKSEITPKYNSPHIFTDKIEEVNNYFWKVPYSVVGVVQDNYYKIHIYEKLYDEDGNNLWVNSWDVGIDKGFCSSIPNCVENIDESQSKLHYNINLELDEYDSGTYLLEITIIDLLTEKEEVENLEIEL